jgi:hypothetical protein
MSNDVTASNNPDTKNMALLIWIGTIFFGFIPGLIMFLIKKEDSFIQSQSKEALNWCITLFILNIVAFILTFIALGGILYSILGICHLIFCIMGVMATSKGNDYKVPFAIRLIK